MEKSSEDKSLRKRLNQSSIIKMNEETRLMNSFSSQKISNFCGFSKKRFFVGLTISILVTAFIVFFINIEITGRKPLQKLYGPSKIDPNSFSNPDQVYAENYHFDWNVDFDRKVISGSVLYNLIALNQNVDKIILDTRSKIKIKQVKDDSTGQPLTFEFGDPYLTFGQPLIISLPTFKVDQSGVLRSTITIEYETSPEASGLQWLTPEQTGGKKFPFLFSQNQPIHARAMFPCQDTPYTKATFTATVRAPKDLVVLMGAVAIAKSTPYQHDPSKNVYKWGQSVPIPSYLVAIAVGDLEYRDLGNMSRIWAEAQIVQEAASDFEDTEKMVAAASSLGGEYVWGRYDMLVLPPSFPYGGMENPCLTFLTPSIITGDKSLTNVIAHEIAHSWSGNLITNKNFEHFWLNEGFTVFLERKILGILQGEQERQFQSISGLLDLKETIVSDLKESNPLTQLVTNLTNVDPDDSFSLVPYEKGSLFLYYLETKIGGPEIMNKFLKIYFNKFSRKSIDTSEWKEFFLNYLQDQGKGHVLDDVDWETWLHKPGMPIIFPAYDRTLYDACIQLRDKWVSWNKFSPESGSVTSGHPFSETDLDDFTSGQIQVFLQLLLDAPKGITINKLKLMQSLYKFQETPNIEILFRWIRIGLKENVKWEFQIPHALNLVTKYGRMKYIRPLYQDLYRWGGQVRELAIETFRKNIPNMMSVSVATVTKDLHLGS